MPLPTMEKTGRSGARNGRGERSGFMIRKTSTRRRRWKGGTSVVRHSSPASATVNGIGGEDRDDESVIAVMRAGVRNT